MKTDEKLALSKQPTSDLNKNTETTLVPSSVWETTLTEGVLSRSLHAASELEKLGIPREKRDEFASSYAAFHTAAAVEKIQIFIAKQCEAKTSFEKKQEQLLADFITKVTSTIEVSGIDLLRYSACDRGVSDLAVDVASPFDQDINAGEQRRKLKESAAKSKPSHISAPHLPDPEPPADEVFESSKTNVDSRQSGLCPEVTSPTDQVRNDHKTPEESTDCLPELEKPGFSATDGNRSESSVNVASDKLETDTNPDNCNLVENVISPPDPSRSINEKSENQAHSSSEFELLGCSAKDHRVPQTTVDGSPDEFKTAVIPDNPETGGKEHGDFSARISSSSDAGHGTSDGPETDKTPNEKADADR